MVDFSKLRSAKSKAQPIEPAEILRRLPKPAGFNDLYTSQADVLRNWFDNRNTPDTVIKLHTGGGKTLVGLLMAQSTLNETKSPVLYLAPTTQLVGQTLERARQFGIPAVTYQRGVPLHEDFLNSKAVMIATYAALFHGMSKFGVEGSHDAVSVAAIILDDAHAAFSDVRDSFTLNVDARATPQIYKTLCDLFRRSFKNAGKGGTFDDIISAREYGVLEVPYPAWRENIGAVEQLLRNEAENHRLVWPLIRDRLNLCHALVSSKNISITPVLPMLNSFPTFASAIRKIYMSATIADDSDLIRTFGADASLVKKPLTSRSLAGVSERMILCPDMMPFAMNDRTAVEELSRTLARGKKGVVFLTPSDKIAEEWAAVASVAKGSDAVLAAVAALQSGSSAGPYAFANRYDGIDLPGDACRLLVMSGLPTGTSEYERFRASALYGGAGFTRMLAQRIEQGIGRGARGAGDHCAVLLVGSALASWIAKDANFNFLTSATQAQLTMGTEISKAVEDRKDFFATVMKCIDRDADWQTHYAETLAELVEDIPLDSEHLDLADAERRAIDLWAAGYHEKAIAKLQKVLDTVVTDSQTKGWVLQLAARIADDWGNIERSEELQRSAYASNSAMLRPRVPLPYQALALPGAQAKAIVEPILAYRMRRGYLQGLEDILSRLHAEASANQFEEALVNLGRMLGFAASRHDDAGVGPDVLWILPIKVGMVIEAKSRKRESNPLKKDEHGQLLVAEEWFDQNYPDHECERVSVVPNAFATEAAMASRSKALTMDRLAQIGGDARKLFLELCESQLDPAGLEQLCQRLLSHSNLAAERIASTYLQPFQEVEKGKTP